MENLISKNLETAHIDPIIIGNFCLNCSSALLNSGVDRRVAGGNGYPITEKI